MYQQIQRRKVFPVGSILAAFVGAPTSDTLFVGLYHVNGSGGIPPGTIDPSTQEEPKTAAIFHDKGCRLCLLPPKVHDGTRTLRCRICSVTYRNNKLRRLLQRATQMPQLGGVSILSPLSGSLN
jgi:hypothetical protein